jgi:hypothetical protein
MSCMQLPSASWLRLVLGVDAVGDEIECRPRYTVRVVYGRSRWGNTRFVFAGAANISFPARDYISLLGFFRYPSDRQYPSLWTESKLPCIDFYKLASSTGYSSSHDCLPLHVKLCDVGLARPRSREMPLGTLYLQTTASRRPGRLLEEGRN